MTVHLSKKRALTLAGVATIALAAFAIAFWTTGGSGSGSAGTASGASNVTVNQTSTPTGLYPGGPTKALSGDFSHSNDGPVYVSSVTAVVSSVSNGASDSSKPACTASDFEISGTSNTPGQIATGDNKGSWSGLSIGLKNQATNQDNCKGATPNITYTANA
jgi:hypothetical protein